MTVSNPPSNNPQSGRSIGQPNTEKTVIFTRPFASKPHVVISAWGKKEVWLTSVTATRFKWRNSANEPITIDWIADEK